jgi:hypothetical protein
MVSGVRPVSKVDFVVKNVTKTECAKILLQHHYLKNISKGFKSGFNYGVFKNDSCVGVVIYTGFPVPELAKEMLGLERNDQEGLFELSRLCLIPEIQQEEHNLASWFLAKSLTMLQKETKVRVVLSYADADFHSGTVYRASNFNYYGLTTLKKDFWVKQSDGSYIKHSRGKVKGIEGEWRKRSQKHRFVLVFDKRLKILWKKVPYEAT